MMNASLTPMEVLTQMINDGVQRPRYVDPDPAATEAERRRQIEDDMPAKIRRLREEDSWSGALNGEEHRRAMERLKRADAVAGLPRRLGRPSSTGLKGVKQLKSLKWVASICIPDSTGRLRMLKYLGTFATAEEAARAYNDAARRYFGENAVLNPV